MGMRIDPSRVRAAPLAAFYAMAESINDSPALMRIYAAPEWDCLSDDGREWVTALVRESWARMANVEQPTPTLPPQIDLAAMWAFVQQIARLNPTNDPDQIDPHDPDEDSAALDNLIHRARFIAAPLLVETDR